MMKKLMIAVTLSCASFALLRPALADTLRCGSALIEPGDDAGYVLEKCGPPNQPATPAARGNVASLYPYGIVRADRWRYHRGRGRFPVVLVIGDDGRVETIRYEQHRD